METTIKTPRSLAATIALVPTPAAFAVTDTQDGGGADNNIASALNWLDNTARASDLVNTDLIFVGAVRLTPNLSAAFGTNSVTFDDTAEKVTVVPEPGDDALLLASLSLLCIRRRQNSTP